MTNEISARNSLLGDLQCSLRVKNLFSILKVTNLLPFVCNKGFDQTDWNAVPFQTVESHPVASSVTNLIVFWVIWLVTDWTGSHTAQRTRKNGNIIYFYLYHFAIRARQYSPKMWPLTFETYFRPNREMFLFLITMQWNVKGFWFCFDHRLVTNRQVS